MERIFELSGPDKMFPTRREFAGYRKDRLEEGAIFLIFNTQASSVDRAVEDIRTLIFTYVNGAGPGNVHWRYGIFFDYDAVARMNVATASLVVSLFTPKLNEI